MSVNTHLLSLGSSLVLGSEKNGISTSVSTLSSRASNYFDTDFTGQFIFGSYDRNTILPRKADSNSDVDYMLVFKKELSMKPQTYLDRVKRFANKYYSSSTIKQSFPTIRLELNHIMFELVPAYYEYGLYYIAQKGYNSDTWQSTDPSQARVDLQTANKRTNYNTKPAIRIVKYWNALNGGVYDSYSIESYIVNSFSLGYYDLKSIVFSACLSLNENGLSKSNTNKVQKLKSTIRTVQQYEREGYPATAESELKKVLPEL